MSKKNSRYRYADTPDELWEILQQLFKGDDRTAVIVGSAFIDDVLEQLLRQHFKEAETYALKNFPGSKRQVEKSFASTLHDLFGPERPLGSFKAKIDLCFALGIVGFRGFTDLSTVRRVRNLFAHPILDIEKKKPISFSTPEVIRLCRSFSDAVIGMSPEKSPRGLFVIACILYSSALHIPIRRRQTLVEHAYQVVP